MTRLTADQARRVAVAAQGLAEPKPGEILVRIDAAGVCHSDLSVLHGAYAQAETDYNRKVFVDALTYARQAENIPEWSQVKDLIQNQLDLIWVGKTSVQAGLKKAAADVNATLKKLRGK